MIEVLKIRDISMLQAQSTFPSSDPQQSRPARRCFQAATRGSGGDGTSDTGWYPVSIPGQEDITNAPRVSFRTPNRYQAAVHYDSEDSRQLGTTTDEVPHRRLPCNQFARARILLLEVRHMLAGISDTARVAHPIPLKPPFQRMPCPIFPIETSCHHSGAVAHIEG